MYSSVFAREIAKRAQWQHMAVVKQVVVDMRALSRAALLHAATGRRGAMAPSRCVLLMSTNAVLIDIGMGLPPQGCSANCDRVPWWAHGCRGGELSLRVEIASYFSIVFRNTVECAAEIAS